MDLSAGCKVYGDGDGDGAAAAAPLVTCGGKKRGK